MRSFEPFFLRLRDQLRLSWNVPTLNRRQNADQSRVSIDARAIPRSGSRSLTPGSESLLPPTRAFGDVYIRIGDARDNHWLSSLRMNRQ
jgi:hypothetical protein